MTKDEKAKKNKALSANIKQRMADTGLAAPDITNTINNDRKDGMP